MSQQYRIYGAEMSPYSVKVRAWFRYKGVAHRWIVRSAERQAEFEKYARLPLIPLVVTPDDEGLQDSTPILERLETAHPEPSIHPDDPVAAFVSILLEEFADEWGNKWMFLYRWVREVDRVAAGGRLARTMLPAQEGEEHAASARALGERGHGRLGFVGSSEQTAPQIESSFREAIAALEPHLARRPYLLGGRPALADLGLWCQLYEAWTDPTPGALIEGRHPNVLDWIQRMLWPRAEGPFEGWSALEPGLMPLLEQVGRLFLPWSAANAAALESGADELRVELDGRTWTQKPQKYHARSLRALRAKYASIDDRSAIDAVLERAGCLEELRRA